MVQHNRLTPLTPNRDRATWSGFADVVVVGAVIGAVIGLVLGGAGQALIIGGVVGLFAAICYVGTYRNGKGNPA